jgi:hypothetical protein
MFSKPGGARNTVNNGKLPKRNERLVQVLDSTGRGKTPQSLTFAQFNGRNDFAAYKITSRVRTIALP